MYMYEYMYVGWHVQVQPTPAPSSSENTEAAISDRTGIVHISKTFGADDYRTSVQNNMPGVFVKDEFLVWIRGNWGGIVMSYLINGVINDWSKVNLDWSKFEWGYR